jgi:hypothetical protein
MVASPDSNDFKNFANQGNALLYAFLVAIQANNSATEMGASMSKVLGDLASGDMSALSAADAYLQTLVTACSGLTGSALATAQGNLNLAQTEVANLNTQLTTGTGTVQSGMTGLVQTGAQDLQTCSAILGVINNFERNIQSVS